MRQRLSSIATVGMTLLLGAGFGLGCDSCPDLWYKAFEFEVAGADKNHVILTATNQGTGVAECQNVALSENCKAGPGAYTLVFEINGVQRGDPLTDVCTLGDQTDCAAEDAEARGPSPLVRVERDATGTWNVTLERQGVCP